MNRPYCVPVLGTLIDALDMVQAVARIGAWAAGRESRAVFACNVHAVVTARSDPALARAFADADLSVPDGAPVAWLMRRLGRRSQRRIAGPDLMQACLASATHTGQTNFLYGGSPDTLERLLASIQRDHPGAQVAGSWSPPYREMTQEEDDAVVDMINASGASIVWVALGCPRQEIWIAEHRSRISAVLIGVGAAFDFHAGTIARAPRWMQRAGIEWLHRLVREPRRLWRRYLVTNSAFMVLATVALLRPV